MKYKVSFRLWIEQEPTFDTAKEAYEHGRACGLDEEDIAVFEVQNQKEKGSEWHGNNNSL